MLVPQKNPKGNAFSFLQILRVSSKWEMVSKCGAWEMQSFHSTVVFYETSLSNITGWSRTRGAGSRGKRSNEGFGVKPNSVPSPAALWTPSAGCCSSEGGLRGTSSMQWFVGLWWRHTTPNLIVKGTCPAIDQNIFVSAGTEPELSRYFQKDSCCFLWYEVRIN